MQYLDPTIFHVSADDELELYCETAFLLSGQSFHAVLLTNETWYQQRTHGKLDNSISLQNPAMMCNL